MKQVLLTLAVLLAASAASALPPEVASVTQGHGVRYTDAGGMTLYTYEKDEKGVPTCNGECAKLRPPLIAKSAPTSPIAGWTLVPREDGAQQWVFNGKPVYTFTRDAFPGAVFGEGDGWDAVFQRIAVPPGVAVGKNLLGQILVAANGMTLYSGDQACTGACLETWTPVVAPWAGTGIGAFSVVARDDGVSQWAFRKKALYLYSGDQKPGDTKGAGVTGDWQAVVLEPAPPIPPWVKVVGSDGGELYADPKGMTLYAYDADRNAMIYSRGEDCFGPCIAESWLPVQADAEVAPIGNWSVMKAEDGSLQWAYFGKPLYTSKLEKMPGDLSGISMRRHRAWRPIMRLVPSLQGPSPNG